MNKKKLSTVHSQLSTKHGYNSIKPDIVELLKLLTSIIKTSKKHLMDNGKLTMDKGTKKA